MDMTYTVIGAYPEAATAFDSLRDGTFIEPVKAISPTIAARIAKRRMAGDDIDPDDIPIIAVLYGDCRGLYEPIVDTAEYEQQVMEQHPE